jgi:hypothetical protein
MLKCDFDGQCEINILNRHVCTACRLKKCLEVGMSTEMIRAPRMKNIKEISRLSKSIQFTNEENKQPQQVKFILNMINYYFNLVKNIKFT